MQALESSLKSSPDCKQVVLVLTEKNALLVTQKQASQSVGFKSTSMTINGMKKKKGPKSASLSDVRLDNCNSNS